MVIIVFRSRTRPGVDQELAQVGGRMFELAANMPGFISYKDFVSEDGENVTLIEWESLETLEAWRQHPEHKLAQNQGRARFFSEYKIQVCTPVRVHEFTLQD